MPQRIAAKFLDKLSAYEHIIWDWNGTVIDDAHITSEVVAEIMEKHNLPRLSLQEYRDLFGFPVRDYYLKLGFDFSKVSFEELSDIFIELYGKKSCKAEVFIGMVETLDALGQDGKKLSILSAASQEHLEKMVKHHDLHIHFTHIFGLNNHYAASKLDRGRELIEVAGVLPRQTILVGDTDHDLEVGEKLGIDVLLVGDGHQCKNRLSKIHHNVLPSRFDSF